MQPNITTYLLAGHEVQQRGRYACIRIEPVGDRPAPPARLAFLHLIESLHGECSFQASDERRALAQEGYRA